MSFSTDINLDKNYKIYKVTNLIDGKVYIGCTKQPIQERKRSHLSLVKNKNGYYFHENLMKCGVDNFRWEVLLYCEKYESYRYEKEIIKLFKSNNKEYGYNLTEGGAGSNGFKHSEKTISLFKNRIFTEEHKTRLSDARIGKKHTDITKEKLSLLRTGEKNHNYGKRILNDDKIKQIKEMSLNGKSQRCIAKHFSIGQTTVSRYIRDKNGFCK